jgi:hypothetical protein
MKMKKNKFLRYWPLTLILAGIALIAVLAVSSTPAQAIASNQSSALQETPPVSTLPVPTVIVPTVIIPETGGDTIFVDFFSGWVLWAVLGLLVIVLLIALIARPSGPTDTTHHHHDL